MIRIHAWDLGRTTKKDHKTTRDPLHLIPERVMLQSMAKIVMYSKDYCPFCDRARNFFESRQINFTEIDLSGKEDEIQRIKNETGWRTVPIILINDKLIGGYTDLKALHESGELDQLLKS